MLICLKYFNIYANDIIIFPNDAKELQESLVELLWYCQRWKSL